MHVRYCTQCVYPETKPDLSFDDDGVCSACRAAEEKYVGIDWKQREHDFYDVINHFRLPEGKPGYDCIVPVSGGKDSTYQAYFMKML